MQDWIIEADIHRIKRQLYGEPNRDRRERLEVLLRGKEAQLRRLKAMGPQPWLPRPEPSAAVAAISPARAPPT